MVIFLLDELLNRLEGEYKQDMENFIEIKKRKENFKPELKSFRKNVKSSGVAKQKTKPIQKNYKKVFGKDETKSLV